MLIQTQAKVSNITTNLSVGAQTGTTLDINSSDGADVTIPEAVSGGNAGMLSGADKTKLNNTSGTNSGDEVVASTTTAGVAELATQAETDTGTDDTRIVTPLKGKTSYLPRLLENKTEALGAGYTVVDADGGKNIILTGTGTFTIPTGLTVGTQFSVFLDNAVAQPMVTTGNTVKGLNIGANITGFGSLAVTVSATNTLIIVGNTEA